MMISRLCARLAARASFTKPFEGYCFDYGMFSFGTCESTPDQLEPSTHTTERHGARHPNYKDRISGLW